MKIHVVQKGDTFWEISKEYGVDFEELKELNPQISSPDMLMPGMKIKIPSSTKPVKKEQKEQKEQKETVSIKEKSKKEVQKTEPKPLQMTTPKDEHETPIEIKTKMPINHQPQPLPKQEKPTQMPKQPIKEMIELPMMTEEIPSSPPKMPAQHQEVEHQPSHIPMTHQHNQPCCQPIHYHCYPAMGQMMPEQHIQHEQMMPNHLQHSFHSQHCGCQQTMPVHPQQARGQMPHPFPLPNYDQLSQQMNTQQLQPQANHYEPLAYPSFPEQHVNQHIGNPFPMPPGYPAQPEINKQEDHSTNKLNDKQVDD